MESRLWVWCLLLSVLTYLTNEYREAKELKNGIIITATVSDTFVGKGPTSVYVLFPYNGKMVKSYFYTFSSNCFRKQSRVRLLVSRRYPQRFMQYLGVENQLGWNVHRP